MKVNKKNERKEESSEIYLDNFINKTFPEKEEIEVINNIIKIKISKNKAKISLSSLEKNIFSKFNKKYKIKYNPKKIYNELIMHTLLFNKNTHLVSVFKDYMIYDYVDEFFKRFYTNTETYERLPKFAIFYKNYLKFFCQPCFSNFHYNGLIQKNREKKAEIFYNKNFRENNKETVEDEGIIEDTDDEEEEVGKSKIEKTIFNETVKKKIEQYSPINNSMNLPESETYLKNDQSGLLISLDNESSLRNILKNIINNKKMKNKFGEEMSSIKKVKLGNNEKEEKNKIQKKNSINNNINNINNKNIIKNSTSKKKENNNICKYKNNNNKDKKNNKINKIKDKNNNLIVKSIKYKINNDNKKNKSNIKTTSINEKKILISSNNLLNNKNNVMTNNDNKDKNIYIKKIELINLNKTRSNSNRNTKYKEKINTNNINSDNNNTNNNKNNNSKKIMNIIKNIKSLDNTKKIQYQTNLENNKNRVNKIYNNSITSVNTQMNKNLSDKFFNNNNNNNITNQNISNKKYISRNKSKKHLSKNIKFIRNEDKTYNMNYQLSNSSKYTKINSYIGLYHKKTISKERKQSKLSEEINDILKSQTKNQSQINNIYSFSPLNRTRKNSTSNINSNFQHYQNLNKSRNNFNRHSSSINNNSSCNNNFNNNGISCNNFNSRYNSSYYSKNQSRHKTFDKINNNKKGARYNKININLLKTQNVEVILNQLKMMKPKIINKKQTRKNTPNKKNNYERRKKISLISFENISVNNNSNMNYNAKNSNENYYNRTNINRIYTKLIKKNKYNNRSKINIISNKKRNDKNLRYNKLKVSPSEYELYHKQLDTNQKSNSINYLNKNIYSFNSTSINNNINKKQFTSNIINFNSNVPNHKYNKEKSKVSKKNTRINSMNATYNHKISCESSQMKGLNFTNITNNTNSNNNTNINIHGPFNNNKDDEISKKSMSTFIIENNNIKDNLYSYDKKKINKNQNIINNNCIKEEHSNNTPLKHIHNVNININNQININNNNQFNDILAFNTKINTKLSKMNKNNIKNLKEIKNGGNKNQNIIGNSKKILISRNKHNSLDFNSLNSFLSANSNFSNLRKNYLNKNKNPVNLLVSSNNSNIKEDHKSTFYINNFNKNKNKNINNYSYNSNNNNNANSNIILLEHKRKNTNNGIFKSFKNNTDKIYINLKNNKQKKCKININDKEEINITKKSMKKSSTYHCLPK